MTAINWSEWGYTEPAQLHPVTGGLINLSFRAEWDSGEVRFVQRLNTLVFPNAAAIEHNLNLVSRHPLATHLVVPERRRDGRFHSSNGWRIFPWIMSSPADPSAHDLGQFWGKVSSELYRNPADWHTVLPNFHSAAARWAQWRAVENLVPDSYLPLAKSLNQWSPHFLRLETELQPVVQHHDAKRSNVLNTTIGLRGIDLDTLQPGYLGSDFADLIRSTAALRSEDDPEPNAANPEVFEAAWTGYKSTFHFAEHWSKTLLQMPAYVTWIQALRFATDAASGSSYYQIAYPEHNWVRANNQEQLLHSLMVIHDRI